MTPVKIGIPRHMHQPRDCDRRDGEGEAERHADGGHPAVSFEEVCRG